MNSLKAVPLKPIESNAEVNIDDLLDELMPETTRPKSDSESVRSSTDRVWVNVHLNMDRDENTIILVYLNRDWNVRKLIDILKVVIK